MNIQQVISCLWDATEAVLRGKCTALNTCIGEEERYLSNFSFLVIIQEKGQIKLKVSRGREIVRRRAKIIGEDRIKIEKNQWNKKLVILKYQEEKDNLSRSIFI